MYQARGLAWYRLNNFDHAIADFSQSINIDAKYIRAFYNRGVAWERKGKLDEALADYKYFADLDPTFPDVQKAIARVSAAVEATAVKPPKIGNKVAAKSAAAQAAQISPPNDAPVAAMPIEETRVALVIGNSAYKKVPLLPNPINDASDVSESLKQLGFTVKTLTNVTFDEMRRNVISFGRQAQGAEIALVFFAGHGMEIGGENWLIPIDAELLSDTDAESEAISLKTVMLQVTKAAKLGLVILDACRNNPFAAKMQRSVRVRSVDRGFARTEPLDNVLVAYSSKDGTTARDGSGRNSPFTAALLRHIQTPGLEVRFLFANVRDDVMAATKREQQPFVYGSLSSERIYFRLPNGTKPIEMIKPPVIPKLVAKPAQVAVAKLDDVAKPPEMLRAVVSFAVTGSDANKVVAVDLAN